MVSCNKVVMMMMMMIMMMMVVVIIIIIIIILAKIFKIPGWRPAGGSLSHG